MTVDTSISRAYTKIYLILSSLKRVNPQANANAIATNKNRIRMIMLPDVKIMIKSPKSNEEIPPISIVQGTIFLGKN